MKIRFEVATEGHARVVAACMRPRDVAEVKAGWGTATPLDAVLSALASSRYARTVFYGLEALAIYGLSPLSWLGESAEVWCFGTEAVDRHRVAFARASRLAVPTMQRHARILTNVVAVHDERAVHWLEWLGAQWPQQPVEIRRGQLFAQFVFGYKEKAECRRG